MLITGCDTCNVNFFWRWSNCNTPSRPVSEHTVLGGRVYRVQSWRGSRKSLPTCKYCFKRKRNIIKNRIDIGVLSRLMMVWMCDKHSINKQGCCCRKAQMRIWCWKVVPWNTGKWYLFIPPSVVANCYVIILQKKI